MRASVATGTSAGDRPGGTGASPWLVAALTTLVMTLFAANSLLCRFALAQGPSSQPLDPSVYTALRAISAAAMLWFIQIWRGGNPLRAGSWNAALALFGYMACFSWAYVRLSAGAGALVIAVAVQVGMLVAGLRLGQRPGKAQGLGIGLAMAGLVYLLLPGLDAPPAGAATVIFCSGLCWAVYTICGRQSGDATAATAGNFIRCVPLALALLAWGMLFDGAGTPTAWPWAGVVCALAAGALASALGYVLWYAVLRWLNVPSAAVVQLSVPLITALGGAWLMGEALGLRLLVSSLAILGGIFCATALPHLLRSR
ncbi:MAG: DMT family transporter [Desulfovibrio sp.]|uniref:DMT family transporter n=1 Tax=Desulfovibrio sp. TaxID=885 RepID=UPI00135EA331|nr:DMT family transporter [Desulfovibrio sp.]MTJ92214.1 DMT family transporter [Desulfovibrio sp.]